MPYVLSFFNPLFTASIFIIFLDVRIWLITFLPLLVVGIHEQVEHKMHSYIPPRIFQ